MSVRFDASTDDLYRGANLPSLTSFTACGWARIISNIGAGTAQPLFWMFDAGLADGVALFWNTNATGAAGMELDVADAGAVVSLATTAGRPAVGEDFFWYVRCSGTGANLLEAGYRLSTQSAFTTTTATLGATIAAPANINFNAVIAAGYYCDKRSWNYKLWDRALSQAELIFESYYQRVVFPASLNAHWWLKNANDTVDRGPNGRNATVAGTLASEDEYPLWKPKPLALRRSAATALTIGLTGSALSSAAGTLGPTASKALSGSALASAQGTLPAAVSNALSGSALASTLGLLSPAAVKALSGQPFASSTGITAPAQSAALSGVSATFSQGTLSASVGNDVSVGLTGIVVTAAQGAFSLGLAKPLTGNVCTFSAGSLSSALAKVMAGSQITFSSGSLTPSVSGPVTVALSGLALSFALGTLTASGGGPQIIDVLVRATAVGHFGGLYRDVGDTFYLSTPYEYSPYWMEFIDPIPASWASGLSLFVQHVDQEVLEFGRPTNE